MPVVARDAASIMLLRDAPRLGGIEVLMVRRHARSDFAVDVYVFPGGGVEESDCGEDMAELCAGMGPEDAMSVIADAPSPARALGLYVAGTPAEALRRNESGAFPMLPPTIINLMALARFATAEEALQSPAGEEVAAILPRLSYEDGKLRLLLPDDPGYD